MAKRPNPNGEQIESNPKSTRQGLGKHTKYAASSRNKARKRYKGQGKQYIFQILLMNAITFTMKIFRSIINYF